VPVGNLIKLPFERRINGRLPGSIHGGDQYLAPGAALVILVRQHPAAGLRWRQGRVGNTFQALKQRIDSPDVTALAPPATAGGYMQLQVLVTRGTCHRQRLREATDTHRGLGDFERNRPKAQLIERPLRSDCDGLIVRQSLATVS
jgi:hypothetical protein